MSCLVIVWFGGLGVDVDNGSADVVGGLFLLGVDVVEEILILLIGTKIILLLVKVAFHCEGGLRNMFGDKSCGKARP